MQALTSRKSFQDEYCFSNDRHSGLGCRQAQLLPSTPTPGQRAVSEVKGDCNVPRPETYQVSEAPQASVLGEERVMSLFLSKPQLPQVT